MLKDRRIGRKQLVHAARRIGGTRGRKPRSRKAALLLAPKPPIELVRLRAGAEHRLDGRVLRDERQLVGPSVADAGVGGSLYVALRDHVPKRNAVTQAKRALLVIGGRKLLAC